MKLFTKGRYNWVLKVALLLLGLNFMTFIVQWRMKRLEKLNDEMLKNINKSGEDSSEKKKHFNKKWTDFE